MDDKQGFPLWISDLVFHHVFPDALEYIPGFCWGAGPPAGGHAAMDLQAALKLGLSQDTVPYLLACCYFIVLIKN